MFWKTLLISPKSYFLLPPNLLSNARCKKLKFNIQNYLRAFLGGRAPPKESPAASAGDLRRSTRESG